VFLRSHNLNVLMIEKADIRASITVECPFNGVQFKVFLYFNVNFQGFEVINFSVQFSKFKIFLSLIIKSTAP